MQILFSVAAIILIFQGFWVYESTYDKKVELFNEYTVLFIFNVMLMFSNYIVDGATRYKVGYTYCVLSIGNILIHVVLLLKNIGKSLKLRCKKRLMKKKAKAMKQRKAANLAILNRLDADYKARIANKAKQSEN